MTGSGEVYPVGTVKMTGTWLQFEKWNALLPSRFYNVETFYDVITALFDKSIFQLTSSG
jgi:hypothetical protein